MRRDDWEARLHGVLKEWSTRDIEWGPSDCSVLIAEVTTAITGEADRLAEFRGRYDDAPSAASLIRQAGFETLQDLIASRWTEVHPAFAHRGDIGYAPDMGPMCLCVVMGPTLVMVQENGVGLKSAPRALLKRAFKVGWE